MESLLNQDYDLFEIVFIDNASTDDSYKLIPVDAPFVSLIRKEVFEADDKILSDFIEQYTDENDICMILDGNSWLSHDRILASVNEHFNEYECDFLYGQYQHEQSERGDTIPFADEKSFLNANSETFQNTTVSFRAKLYCDLIQPKFHDVQVAGFSNKRNKEFIVYSLAQLAEFKKVNFTDEVFSVLASGE